MKKCFKCGALKPLTYFYKHPQMSDGRVNKCKECNKADVRKNRAAKVDYYRAYDAKRFQEDPKVKERHRKYRATPDGKASSNASRKRWLDENPDKRAAHVILGNAVRNKIVSKPEACCACGARGRIEGHHDDYSKPLDVIWLCPKCHRKIHNKMGES